jgi:predicted nuclease of restriction endonuclease-like (RecB) superfamily
MQLDKNQQFSEVINLIKQSHTNAVHAVNTELINLYWNVGAYIVQQLSKANWGEKTVDELADYIQKNAPDIKGFNRRGLYRMKQFYETYSSSSFVSSSMTQLETGNIRNTILTKVSWTHHLTLMSRTKTEGEREFYIQLCIREKYSVKELERQINSGIYERTMLGNTKLSTAAREQYPEISNSFKDDYVIEFVGLSDPHTENDLQKGLIQHLKSFILELGKDFLFVGEEYKLQVGNSDFYIDLLFFHRGLQCLVAFELKADKFKPEHLGQLDFYLEALDRDVKKPNENPSIGVLLCKDKDNEVVKYALSRSLSPTMVSEYKTQLPDKKLLQQKLHEFFRE